jgi:hypothetical protein
MVPAALSALEVRERMRRPVVLCYRGFVIVPIHRHEHSDTIDAVLTAATMLHVSNSLNIHVHDIEL